MNIYDIADAYRALHKANRPGLFREQHPFAVSAAQLIGADGSVVLDADLLRTGDLTAVAALRTLLAADGSLDAEVVSATNVIAATESGKTFFLSSATEFVSTLPLPALGLKFEFIVGAAPSGASYTIVTNGSANIIKGSIVTSATGAADTEVSGGDTINFVDGTAVAGDRVILKSDGTSWFAYGQCVAAGGVTITTAS